MIIATGARLGRYRLESLLGAGGMAEVWKATIVGAAGFERTVVVKRVLTHLARDASFVQMFLAEARLSALLSHPNIVQVHELGQVGNEYFMAMEYVHGCDLGWVMRRNRPLPIGFAVFLVQAVARALGYAHALHDQAGNALCLVHRDVSPSNIMLGAAGAVKLLDFGIAKARGASTEHRTETGTLKGKLGYMSPEQVDGKPLDHRADLFAAGVVLHELLATRRLFKAESEFLTLSRMRDAEVARPSAHNPEVSPALDAVCLKLLARDPAQRYPSGEALVEALEPFLDGWNPDRARALIGDLLAERERAAAFDASTMTADAAIDATAARPASAPSLRASPLVHPAAPRRRRSAAWLLAGAAVVGAAGAVGLEVFRAQQSDAAHVSAPLAPAVMLAPGAASPASAAGGDTLGSAARVAPTPAPTPPLAPTLPPSADDDRQDVDGPAAVEPAAVGRLTVEPRSPARPAPRKHVRRKSARKAASSSSASSRPPGAGTAANRPVDPDPRPTFDPESALPYSTSPSAKR